MPCPAGVDCNHVRYGASERLPIIGILNAAFDPHWEYWINVIVAEDYIFTNTCCSAYYLKECFLLMNERERYKLAFLNTTQQNNDGVDDVAENLDSTSTDENLYPSNTKFEE